MLASLVKAAQALKSVAVGLGITGPAIAKTPVTVKYPYAELHNLEHYRGHIELVGRDDDPAKPRCIACGSCMDVCPSSCIIVGTAASLDVLRSNQGNGAVLHASGLVPVAAPLASPDALSPTRYVLDYSKCSLCGQCVRACPAKAIRFSDHVYYIGRERGEFKLDLLQRLARQAGQGGAK